MHWTDLHGSFMKQAFEKVLGSNPARGSVAFVRCLTPDVVAKLAADDSFAPQGWKVYRVAGEHAAEQRSITADRAVELREAKEAPILLLVDTEEAGAGMDGIYSAAQEVAEADLFKSARRLAETEIGKRLSKTTQQYAEDAIKVARRQGKRYSISLWTEFDYLVRIVAERRDPGELLDLLGLWPVDPDETVKTADALRVSQIFVERLLAAPSPSLTPAQRVASLQLLNPSDLQKNDLERMVRSTATQPLLRALKQLAGQRHLWVNQLRLASDAATLQSLQLVPWRSSNGKLVKWSGLEKGEAEGEDGMVPPVFYLSPNKHKEAAKLGVRWKVLPNNLAKGAAEYHVAILTDHDEEIARREVVHTGKSEEQCQFTADDFEELNEDAIISAKVAISVQGREAVEPQKSEEFTIRFGTATARGSGGLGKKVRTLSEGVIELDDLAHVRLAAVPPAPLPPAAKGFRLLRTAQRNKNFQVYEPSLLREVEEQWVARSGAIGRWRVQIHPTGILAGAAEFIPYDAADPNMPRWQKVCTESRRMAERFRLNGGVGQVYDEQHGFDVVRNYLLAWAAFLEQSDPLAALAHTIEVQTLSGKTIGLIVLPSHPLRVAWHAAYDNLVLYSAFEKKIPAKKIRDEFKFLDGAMFPAFLPGVHAGQTFVFADMLGFHAAAMVPDNDKEPKAALSLLARALGKNEGAETAPTVGVQSAQILGNAIHNYIDCHQTTHLLHVHALRPGDGFTIARSLGYVQRRQTEVHEASDEQERENSPQSFVLNLYPSETQRGVAGRFLAEAREKRRSGAGALAEQDRWMFESTARDGGVNLPRLRWARKEIHRPETAAHLTVAFDTFESQVVMADDPPSSAKLYVYGLLTFFERTYVPLPVPMWRSRMPIPTKGEKHPSDKTHTDRLLRVQEQLARSVARHLGDNEQWAAALQTKISPEMAENLNALHRVSDWVITLDRNAGIEYFDSPRDNPDIYDAYVIDAVPEREDLGSLQLVTSTRNLEEIHHLLKEVLDQLGLRSNWRNAEFLLQQLKALSGRLAIRITGQNAIRPALIALALAYANCLQEQESPCWVSLEHGFLIPVEEVVALLPQLSPRDKERTPAETEQADPPAQSALLYVSLATRQGFSLQWIEVHSRRHLRSATDAETLDAVQKQLQALRKRWDDSYGENVEAPLRALRLARLARVLRFYADRAARHHLPPEKYKAMVAEIDRMIEKGEKYSMPALCQPDRGWMFCPEYSGKTPQEITPPDWPVTIFLFGPLALPDSDLPDNRHGGDKPELDAAERAAEQRSAPVPQNLRQPESPPPQAGPQTGTAEPVLVLGADLRTEKPVTWPLTVKGNPHLLIAGLPGMGKTTCLLNLCTQMLDAGIRPIIFSYHQDIDEELARRTSAIRYIDFHRLGFNPLQVFDRQSTTSYLDIAGNVRDIFTAIYPELGDIQGEKIRSAVKKSFEELGWNTPRVDPATLAEPAFGRFWEILCSEPKPDRSVQSLLTRLNELADYGFFAEADRTASLWESEGPTIVRIHGTANDALQKAFAALVLYRLYKDMFRRGTQARLTHCIFFDEAHRAARLSLLPTMAKECRKYGISLVVASQEARDFHPSLFAAIANYLILKLNEPDAKALVTNVIRSNQQKNSIDHIKGMERFQAYYLQEGHQLPVHVSLRMQ
jgi:hypothetical protein